MWPVLSSPLFSGRISPAGSLSRFLRIYDARRAGGFGRIAGRRCALDHLLSVSATPGAEHPILRTP